MTRQHRRLSRTSRRARPGLESLEGRTLLSTFTLDSQGNLSETTPTGQLKIASGVASFQAPGSGDAVVYETGDTHVYLWMAGTGQEMLTDSAAAYAACPDGGVYVLNQSGTLYHWSPQGWSPLIASGVASIQAPGSGDAVVYETGDTHVYLWTVGQAGQEMLTDSAAAYAACPDGGVYVLNQSGTLYHWSPQGWSPLIASGVASIQISPDGSVYALNTVKQLFRYTVASGAFTQIGWNVTSFQVSADGSVYALNTVNQLFRYTAASGVFTQIGTNVVSFVVFAGGLYTMEQSAGSDIFYKDEISDGEATNVDSHLRFSMNSTAGIGDLVAAVGLVLDHSGRNIVITGITTQLLDSNTCGGSIAAFLIDAAQTGAVAWTTEGTAVLPIFQGAAAAGVDVEAIVNTCFGPDTSLLPASDSSSDDDSGDAGSANPGDNLAPPDDGGSPDGGDTPAGSCQ
ncbi:MAG: hypothetical protein ACLQGP_31080 [Isosphaeraceae bacterium]